mgnify:CR=1 FL=1
MNTADCKQGFTLIELLIGMAISAIVMAAVISVFLNIQSTSNTIDQRSSMAMASRNAMALIEDNIRLMGFNPEGDMNRRQIMNTADGCCARGGFFMFNRNDLEDPTDDDQDVTIGIGLNAADDRAGGDRDGFADNGASGLVIQGQHAAANIEAIRFAYAFDESSDGNVDLSVNGNIRWAIDADGDGDLDSELDTNDDGQIDANDSIGGRSMPETVSIDKIQAVKVWLLVQSKHPIRGSTEKRTFVVGDQRYAPNDDFAHRLLTTTIRCRNMS